MNKIPTSKLSRTKVVGKAILKIGAKKSKHLLKGGSKSKNAQEIADVIFDALKELRGVSVKIAQQIALGMPFLSQEYLEKISKSFNQIPPLNRVLVRKIIKTELGKYPEDIFDEFNLQAFAGASLGQVHKASLDGKSLAIKVQYPGIKESIKSDIAIIHFALKRFAKGESVEHIVGEIEERLFEEVDYTLEATNQELFRENLQNRQIVIPKVYKELSTSRVLTTEFIEGLSLDEFLKTKPCQEERDTYAQLIFDNFFYTLYGLKKIHADPNPGNFLFLNGGKLALIDFGCVKEVDKEFLQSYNQLHLDLLNGADDEVLVEHYYNLNMIPKGSHKEMLKFYQEVIKPLDRLYIEPLKNKSYNFGNNCNFSKRGFEEILNVQKKQYHSVHQVNQEYLFLDRTLLGYYAIFERLEATIDTEYIKELMRSFKWN